MVAFRTLGRIVGAVFVFIALIQIYFMAKKDISIIIFFILIAVVFGIFYYNFFMKKKTKKKFSKNI